MLRRGGRAFAPRLVDCPARRLPRRRRGKRGAHECGDESFDALFVDHLHPDVRDTHGEPDDQLPRPHGNQREARERAGRQRGERATRSRGRRGNSPRTRCASCPARGSASRLERAPAARVTSAGRSVARRRTRMRRSEISAPGKSRDASSRSAREPPSVRGGRVCGRQLKTSRSCRCVKGPLSAFPALDMRGMTLHLQRTPSPRADHAPTRITRCHSLAVDDSSDGIRPGLSACHRVSRQCKSRSGNISSLRPRSTPADKFAIKPTPAQMSCGDIVVRLIQGNDFLCAATGGMKAPAREDRRHRCESDARDTAARNIPVL